VNFKNKLAAKQSSALLSILSDEAATFKSGRLLYKVSAHRGKRHEGFRYALALLQPNNLRLDLLPTIGAYTLSILTYDGCRAVLLNPREHTAEVSSDINSLLLKTLGFNISIEDLFYLIAGRPSPDFLKKSELFWTRPQNGSTADLLFINRQKYIYWLYDSTKAHFKKAYIANPYSGTASIVIMFSSFEQGISLTFPRKIVLRDQRAALTVELTLKKKTINKPIAKNLFKIDVPDNFKVSLGSFTPLKGIERGEVD